MEENNCFTFVLAFLTMLNQHPFTGNTDRGIRYKGSHNKSIIFEAYDTRDLTTSQLLLDQDITK